MPEAYTVFWASDTCAAAAAVSEPLRILFGGPHGSLPSFLRAKVVPGDHVYPIAVREGALFVLGRMRVDEIRAFTAGTIGRLHQEHVDPNRQWRFLTGSCMTEAVLGSEGTTLRMDAPMPPETLRRLTYRSQRGARPVKHVDEDGILRKAMSVQGIYRVDASSVADVEAVLAQPPGRRSCVAPRRRTPAPAQDDALFWLDFGRRAQ